MLCQMSPVDAKQFLGNHSEVLTLKAGSAIWIPAGRLVWSIGADEKPSSLLLVPVLSTALFAQESEQKRKAIVSHVVDFVEKKAGAQPWAEIGDALSGWMKSVAG